MMGWFDTVVSGVSNFFSSGAGATATNFLSNNAAPLLAVGGSAYTAYAQNQAAREAEDAANQELAFSGQRTGLEASRFARSSDRNLATQKAILSKAGRSLKSGSAYDILNQQQQEDQLDADIIRLGGDIEAARFVREGEKQKRLATTRPLQTLLTGGSTAFSLVK